jgi:hypothetical protein
MPPAHVPSTVTRWLCPAFVVMLLLASCGPGSWGVEESDVPREATLAYPGSELRSRAWNPGDKGTYIDGGSAEYAPRLALDYDVAPTAPEELLGWYSDQLRAIGYGVRLELPSAGFGQPGLDARSTVDGFDVRVGVKAILEDDGTVILYSVIVVVTPETG